MSYSNGLSESTSTKIIEGIAGVGLKLTTDGNYDMENKKLTNLKAGTDDRDALTKKQIYDHIKANGGSVDLSPYLKKHGRDKMSGVLNMDNRRIENIAPARHGHSYAVSSIHLNTYYFDFNDNKIETQCDIDMKNKKIINLADTSTNGEAMTKAFFENQYFKINQYGDIF